MQKRRNPQALLRFSVEASGIERDWGQIESTEEHRSRTISTDDDPVNLSDRASKCAILRAVVTEWSQAHDLSNVVETALARALVSAAGAKRWDVATQIVEELRRRGSAELTSLAASERLKGSSKTTRHNSAPTGEAEHAQHERQLPAPLRTRAPADHRSDGVHLFDEVRS